MKLGWKLMMELSTIIMKKQRALPVTRDAAIAAINRTRIYLLWIFESWLWFGVFFFLFRFLCSFVCACFTCVYLGIATFNNRSKMILNLEIHLFGKRTIVC